MPNIIQISHFSNPNELNIPLSVESPSANPSANTPNQQAYLTQLITRIEKSILINALGVTVYNELQLALADIDNPIYAQYKKLVQGEEYDDKVWLGLSHELSLIAFKIYEVFLNETNEHLTGIGNVQVNPESSSRVTPMYKIANASQKFAYQYQNGYCEQPIITSGIGYYFEDWFGNSEDVYVSFYQYLLDKKDDFTGLDLTKFKFYSVQNTFGL